MQANSAFTTGWIKANATSQCKPLYNGSQPVYPEDIMSILSLKYNKDGDFKNASYGNLGMLHLSVRRHHDPHNDFGLGWSEN